METYRGKVRQGNPYGSRYRQPYQVARGIWAHYVEPDPPDRPHEEWALSYFKVDSYDKAAKIAADEYNNEDSEISEEFENGYWTISNPWHNGRGKTKDAAWVDFYHDVTYNYEGD